MYVKFTFLSMFALMNSLTFSSLHASNKRTFAETFTEEKTPSSKMLKIEQDDEDDEQIISPLIEQDGGNIETWNYSLPEYLISLFSFPDSPKLSLMSIDNEDNEQINFSTIEETRVSAGTLEIPPEIVTYFLSFLDYPELSRMSEVSKGFYMPANDSYL